MKKCNLCGKCRHFCPVFEAERIEKYSPRARLAVFEITQDFNASLGSCILCGNCKKMCPFGIYAPKFLAEAEVGITESNKKISATKETLFVNTTQIDLDFLSPAPINASNFFEDFYGGNALGVDNIVQSMLRAERVVFYDTTHKLFFENFLDGVIFIDYIDYAIEKNIIDAEMKIFSQYEYIEQIIDYQFIPIEAYIERYKDIALKVVKNNLKNLPNSGRGYFSKAIDPKVVALLKEAGINAVEYTKLLPIFEKT